MGVVYLTRNIQLLGPQFIRSLCWALGVAVSTITPLIALTFKTQQRMITSVIDTAFPRIAGMKILGIGVQTWSTMFLTMGESSLLVGIIMGELFKKERSKGLFQTVLNRGNVQVGPLAQITENGGILVSDHHHQHSSSRLHLQGQHHKIMEKASASTSHYGQRMGLWLVTLPLNFVPVAGPIAFCYLNGKVRSRYVHRQYFDMKDMTQKERDDWIQKRKVTLSTSRNVLLMWDM